MTFGLWYRGSIKTECRIHNPKVKHQNISLLKQNEITILQKK